MSNPDVVFADEPTAALDKDSGREAVTMLQEMAAEGSTIVMVTHDPLAAQTARRTLHLEDGKLVSDSLQQTQ